jgi:hypothetical protein
LAQDHVSALREDGSEVAAKAGDGMGRRYYFRTIEGGLIPQVVPPAGFDPMTASPKALETFGYPDRPGTASPQRAEWAKKWGHRTVAASAEPGYCELPVPAEESSAVTGAPSTEFRAASTNPCSVSTQGALGAPTNCYSPNYAGAMGTGPAGRYTAADMGWAQTAYKSETGCPNQAYVTWTGFGGIGTGKLMQAGTINGADATGTDLSHSAMFWEVIKTGLPGPVTAVRYMFTSTDPQRTLVSGGDSVDAYVSYNPSTGRAYFSVDDLNTGVIRSTGSIANVTYNGTTYPMSTFYDGRQAMFLTELPPGGFSLRQPYLNSTRITSTFANGSLLTVFPAVNIQNATTPADVIQNSGFNHVSTFFDVVKTANCQ